MRVTSGLIKEISHSQPCEHQHPSRPAGGTRQAERHCWSDTASGQLNNTPRYCRLHHHSHMSRHAVPATVCRMQAFAVPSSPCQPHLLVVQGHAAPRSHQSDPQVHPVHEQAGAWHNANGWSVVEVQHAYTVEARVAIRHSCYDLPMLVLLRHVYFVYMCDVSSQPWTHSGSMLRHMTSVLHLMHRHACRMLQLHPRGHRTGHAARPWTAVQTPSLVLGLGTVCMMHARMQCHAAGRFPA